MRGNSIWVVGAVLALVGCSASPNTDNAAAASPANLRLTKAQLSHIQFYTVTPTAYRQRVEAPATVDFDNNQATSVVSPFTGPVTRIFVAVGQPVAKGQPLAAVASADVAAAIAAYRKAAAAAANARRVASADRDLAAHNGISAREAAQAQTDAASAEADRVAALQALASMGVDRGAIAGSGTAGLTGIIRAPVSGTVVDKQVTPGQLLQAGSSTAFTVANLSQMWVLAEVDPSDLASVGVGDTAEIDPGNGTGPFHGRVENVSASVDPDTRAVVARIVAPNPGGQLKKQMFVHVAIESGRLSSGTLVPVAAVLRDDENLPFVFVALPDGTFVRRQVTLGYRDAVNYAVTSGLRSGDKIVANGAIFLQFMQSQ